MFKHKPDTRHDSYHICPITSYYILWQLYIIYIIISFSHFYFIFQFVFTGQWLVLWPHRPVHNCLLTTVVLYLLIAANKDWLIDWQWTIAAFPLAPIATVKAIDFHLVVTGVTLCWDTWHHNSYEAKTALKLYRKFYLHLQVDMKNVV